MYGSNYKVDPDARLVIVFMINQIPNRTDLGNRFPTLVYQALVDAPSRESLGSAPMGAKH